MQIGRCQIVHCIWVGSFLQNFGLSFTFWLVGDWLIGIPCFLRFHPPKLWHLYDREGLIQFPNGHHLFNHFYHTFAKRQFKNFTKGPCSIEQKITPSINLCCITWSIKLCCITWSIKLCHVTQSIKLHRVTLSIQLCHITWSIKLHCITWSIKLCHIIIHTA